jgi:hypothetical protein
MRVIATIDDPRVVRRILTHPHDRRSPPAPTGFDAPSLQKGEGMVDG